MDHAKDRVLTIEITFDCSLCGGIFALRSELHSHKCHVPKKRRPYLCELCGYFVQPDRMQTHYQQIHQKFTQLDCCACASSFAAEQDLVVHQNTAHYDGKNKKHKCHICGRGYSTTKSMKRHHLVVHAGDRDVLCAVCKQSFPSRHDMLVHLRSAHRDRREFECADCGRSLPTRKSLGQHRRRVHENQVPLCDLCDAGFGRRRDSLRHWRTVHAAEKQSKQDEATDGETSKNKRYRCGMCAERFVRGRDMRLHELLLHGRRKEFACEDCEKSYDERQQLARHRRNFHGGQRDYCCPICGRGYSRKESMKRHHLSMHESDKDVLCDVCELSFPTRHDVLAHRRSAHHVVRKVHECADCGAKFPTKRGLCRHGRVAHERKGRLVCDACQAEFATKRDVLRHWRAVHEERAKCSRGYRRKAFATSADQGGQRAPLLEGAAVPRPRGEERRDVNAFSRIGADGAAFKEDGVVVTSKSTKTMLNLSSTEN